MRFASVMLVCALALAAAGCASTGAMESEIQKLRSELKAELADHAGKDAASSEERIRKLRAELKSELGTELREEVKRDTASSEDRIRKDLAELEAKVKKEIVEADGKVRKEQSEADRKTQAEISGSKEAQAKASLENEKSHIELQKQIFLNKSVVDDNARRVYMLESIVSARGMVVPQQQGREGYVTFVEGSKASLSLGSVNGVKAGDRFAVIRENARIGAIEVETVERESSRGIILPDSKKIAIGDRAEPSPPQ